MKKLLIFLMVMIPSQFLMAQTTGITVSGYVYNTENGESVGEALVYSDAGEYVRTNNYGFFSLKLNQRESQKLTVQALGFEKYVFTALGKADTTVSIYLKQKSLETVDIISSRSTEKISNNSKTGTIDLDQQTIEKIPSLMGERDVIRALQLMPGVTNPGDGNSGIYVRGGGPDQNLILLDGANVYNATHLLGFFSVFNSDAVQKVELIKGGFPARYGGRLSSVINVSMKEGNMKKFGVDGTVGLLSARLMVEGPIVKDKVSFMVSGRRTYFDLITAPISKSQLGVATGYYFYDLNAKINYKINNKHRIFLSGYFGEDKAYGGDKYEDPQYQSNTKFRLKWGNATGTFRWNWIIHPKLFVNTILNTTYYNFKTGYEVIEKFENANTADYSFTLGSGILDLGGRIQFEYFPKNNHHVRFGMAYIYHTFNPGKTLYRNGNTNSSTGANAIFGHETQLFLEDDFTIKSRLFVNAGAHLSTFTVKNKTYPSIQPRLSMGIKVNENMSVKTSYAEMSQFIHLLSNPGISLPTDLWLPVKENIKPMRSRQVSLGLYNDWKYGFTTEIEGFYKHMNNVLDYKNGANLFITGNDWPSQFTVGTGECYGLELFLRRNVGKFSGWVGYTLSWNWRKFPDINNGKRFPYRFDRRHDFEFFISYEINPKIEIAATWVYATGNAITIPDQFSEIYSPFDPQASIYMGTSSASARNNFRMQDYHRLDISVSFKKDKKWGQRIWNLSIYNVYNRLNPYFYFYQAGTLTKLSIMPILPSVSYTFKIR